MWDKRRYATHIVSNLTFDPDAIKVWVRRMRDRGITMPLLLGLPGPVERTKLLAMATKIGVGESTRFLVKHKGTLARLAAPGGFTGERFLEQCAPALAAPDAPSRACTSSRSTRSPRPRPGARTCCAACRAERGRALADWPGLTASCELAAWATNPDDVRRDVMRAGCSGDQSG